LLGDAVRPEEDLTDAAIGGVGEHTGLSGTSGTEVRC
jgi:hypothetical protein